MFRFGNLSAFHWLWLALIVFVVTFLYFRWRQNKIKKTFDARVYEYLTQSLARNKRRWKLFLQYLTVVLMVLALARPQFGGSKEEIKSEGVEIVILFDVSESMMADDIKPSRLDQAKAELSKLVDNLAGNRVAVIAFAGSSALMCPLTNDVSAIKMYLESLSIYSVSSQGTNFQEALRVAAEAFDRGGVGNAPQQSVTRVVLIASDGEDQEPGAIEEAKKIVEKGLRIFTVAYGTEKGGAIPVRDNMGYLSGYKKDRSGQTVLSTVKGDFLRQLAEAGKGSFYFSTFGGDHLKKIVEDIGKLEKSQFESSVAVQYEEKFQIFLLVAMLIGFLEWWLGERKTITRQWKGRFEVIKE